jgi:hypothetical protein
MDQITLDGVEWDVTVNLANALRFLRRPNRLVRIWIDALCINQDDPIERGNQVRLMGSIYTLCDSVIVYLGDGKTHRPSRGLPAWLKEPIVFSGNDEQDDAHLAAFWKALPVRGAPLSNFHIFCLLRILGDIERVELLLNSVSKGAIEATNFARVVERLRLMLLSPWWQRVW